VGPNIDCLLAQQARALGKFFVDTRYTAIYTSDLKRAFGTAHALCEAQKDPKPTFDSSELLREQHFGDAEGRPYGCSGHVKFEQVMAYPSLYSGDEKFPGGESMNELGQRARRAITTLLLPHVWQAAKEGKTGIHVAVVSHGRCISQMISELLQMSTKQAFNIVALRRCLLNTAWTRLVIDIEVRMLR
jgi:broad specificity phosphatase PhoE